MRFLNVFRARRLLRNVRVRWTRLRNMTLRAMRLNRLLPLPGVYFFAELGVREKDLERFRLGIEISCRLLQYNRNS